MRCEQQGPYLFTMSLKRLTVIKVILKGFHSHISFLPDKKGLISTLLNLKYTTQMSSHKIKVQFHSKADAKLGYPQDLQLSSKKFAKWVQPELVGLKNIQTSSGTLKRLNSRKNILANVRVQLEFPSADLLTHQSSVLNYLAGSRSWQSCQVFQELAGVLQNLLCLHIAVKSCL